MNDDPKPFFGYQDYQIIFAERFKPFLEMSEKLNRLFVEVEQKADKPSNALPVQFGVMYFLYRQVVEEFNGILILCANGFSRGATILLRAMYENCVTLKFFQMCSTGETDCKGNDISRFLDFGAIAKRKKLGMFKQAYQGDLSREDFGHIDQAADAVKEKFLITDCKSCGTKKQAFRWSKMDIISMAAAAKLSKDLTFFCYTEALSYSHPSADYIERRVETDENGNWGYRFESPSDERKTLMYAHLMTLIGSEALLRYSEVDDTESILSSSAQDWEICWGTTDALEQT
jgi:hypothetical protein